MRRRALAGIGIAVLIVSACGPFEPERKTLKVPGDSSDVPGATGTVFANATTTPTVPRRTTIPPMATTVPRASVPPSLPPPPSTVVPVAPPATTAPLSAAQQMSAKLAPYLSCIHRDSRTAAYTAGFYFRVVDRAVGPRPGDDIDIVDLGDVAGCVSALSGAKARPPSLPELDAAGDAYARALSALAPVVKSAAVYYGQGDDQDDNLARGIAMHPQLVAAFDAFAAADRALVAIVAPLDRRAREQDVTAREVSKGRTLDVVVDRSMLAADDLAAVADSVTWDGLERLDIGLMNERVAAYEKLLEEIDGATPRRAGSETVVSAGREFLRAAKNELRRARDRIGWSSGDRLFVGSIAEWMVEGAPGQVRHYHNALVVTYYNSK